MDILHDNSYRVLASIADAVGEAGMPDYVANREIMDQKQAAELDDMDFANPADRLYPLNSKEAIWMSAAYFEHTRPEVENYKQAGMSDYVQTRIKQAARVFGIGEDVDAAVAKIKEARIVKESESDYGLPDKKRFRVTSPEELKVASEYFDENRVKYPTEVREKVSSFLVKKAFTYGVDTEELPSSVVKEAGFGIPDHELLLSEINERMKVASDPSCAILLGNINLLLECREGCDLTSNIEKIASIIKDFDAIEGLDKQYGKTVPYPADILCAKPISKAAAECSKGISIDGHVFDAEKLASVLEIDLLRDSMGEKFADECSSDGKVDPEALKKAVDGLDESGHTYFRSVVGLLCD
jgi:hypothetical protein